MPEACLLHHVTDACCADAAEDLVELAAGDAEEGHAGLARYRFGQQRFACGPTPMLNPNVAVHRVARHCIREVGIVE